MPPPPIAIVGMACRYPDARSPRELWQMALAGRRAFRRIPEERLKLSDYARCGEHDPDSIYPIEAALIEDYSFDRGRFRVPAATFAAADMTHWLALDVASQALDDAGFTGGTGLPHDETGVIVGNTLTGEFSRAALMRNRWPYVRRIVAGTLADAGVEAEPALLQRLEQSYKAPFSEPNEESLAGGLANIIAGRICNHFGLRGGGFTVDGTCAASLLAIATACAQLASGQLEVAIAGAVDLSIDPFELVGFARNGALAPQEMRVFDTRAAGFWPGEGCGMLVQMRRADAVKQGRRIYASIRGWGISTDGHDGLTRPTAEGAGAGLAPCLSHGGIRRRNGAIFRGARHRHGGRRSDRAGRHRRGPARRHDLSGSGRLDQMEYRPHQGGSGVGWPHQDHDCARRTRAPARRRSGTTAPCFCRIRRCAEHPRAMAAPGRARGRCAPASTPWASAASTRIWYWRANRSGGARH